MVNYSPRILHRTFAALADPIRRRLLESLAQSDRCVTYRAKPCHMPLPAVSKHLRVLGQWFDRMAGFTESSQGQAPLAQ